jgi:rhomboid protease GluP
MGRRTPVTILLLVAIAAGYVLQLVTGDSLTVLGANYGPAIRGGQYWRPVTSMFLHGGIVHLALNAWALFQIGALLELLVGSSWMLVVYFSTGIAGSLASALFTQQPSVGASGAIFGLLGALVHYGRKSGSSLIHAEAMRYAVILFVFGLIMPGVDNYAHAGGFLGGYAMSAFFNPLTRERGDHLLAALGCLSATLASIVFSYLTPII